MLPHSVHGIIKKVNVDGDTKADKFRIVQNRHLHEYVTSILLLNVRVVGLKSWTWTLKSDSSPIFEDLDLNSKVKDLDLDLKVRT